MVLAAGADVAVPVVLGRFVDIYVSNHGRVHRDVIITNLAVITGLLLATQLLQVVRRQLVETVATAFERDTRSGGLSHVLHLGSTYFEERQSGAVYTRTTRGIEGATHLLKLSFMDLFPTVGLGVAAVIVALTRNVWMGLTTFAVVPTSLALVAWQIRSQNGVRVAIRDAKEAIDGMVLELLPRVDVVRANHAEAHFARKVQAGAHHLRGQEMRHHRAMAAFDSAKYANEAFWFVAVLVTVMFLVSRGSMGPGDILAAALLFNKVLAPLQELHKILDESSESGRQTSDLYALLAEPRDVSYSIGADGGTQELGSARQAFIAVDPTLKPLVLAMRDVSLELGRLDDHAEARVLNGMTFFVHRGERVALVGRSGSGKSTLLKLVERLQHGYTGEIELFGAPLQTISRGQLATRVGYVSQEAFLFRGTIRENILFGLDESTCDDSLVQHAAMRADVHHVIMRLPQGYDTVVHEGGRSLSGGERQRVCLARALVRDPELLLLDEPTAALDNESQKAIQATIDGLRDVTILVAAHRLVSVSTVDRILVLDDGRIVQDGPFNVLARDEDGLFAQLLAAETSGKDGHRGSQVREDDPELIDRVGLLALSDMTPCDLRDAEGAGAAGVTHDVSRSAGVPARRFVDGT
jgi:ATP-binding cassette subfamily B protein